MTPESKFFNVLAIGKTQKSQKRYFWLLSYKALNKETLNLNAS